MQGKNSPNDVKLFHSNETIVYFGNVYSAAGIIESIGYRRVDKDDKEFVQVLNKFQFKIILFIAIEISFSVSMEWGEPQ